MKEILINKESYKNLISMLKSTPEDKVVALTTIDNLNRKKDYCKILLLAKLSDASINDWEQNAPKTFNWLRDNNFNIKTSSIKYQDIFDFLRKKKASIEDIQFFLDEFGSQLTDIVKGLGHDFVNSIEIKITYNDKR